ncbi:hypothetical protein HYH02_000643 [Chlamydomonas schloesseri]|uniref:AB hydrolase-1 domain-containing protein n=1 Tax=Chlamydomonas schloesseri TaxID=2026947 RepID=A0A835WW80_9CHLO|nr:hypothetical protein HYH02_000643 [Chlamydomonas schloesseri]|eukprot:KAG2454811.1 hypothetical protein HYH02_000643 [Chlamydomonas schloesseri]
MSFLGLFLPRLDSTSLLSFALLLCATAAVPPRVRVVILGSEVLFAAVLRVRFRRQNQVATRLKAGDGVDAQHSQQRRGPATRATAPAPADAPEAYVRACGTGSVQRYGSGPVALMPLWTRRRQQVHGGPRRSGSGAETAQAAEAYREQELLPAPPVSSRGPPEGCVSGGASGDTAHAAEGVAAAQQLPVAVGLLRGGGGLISGLCAVVGGRRQRRRRAGANAAHQRSARESLSDGADGDCGATPDLVGDLGRTGRRQPAAGSAGPAPAAAQPAVLPQQTAASAASAAAAAVDATAAAAFSGTQPPTGARRRFWRRRQLASAAPVGSKCACGQQQQQQQQQQAAQEWTSTASAEEHQQHAGGLRDGSGLANAWGRPGSGGIGIGSSSKLQSLALMAVVDGAAYNDAAARAEMLAARLLDPQEGHVPLLQGGHLLSQWFAGLAGPHQLSLAHLEQLLTYLLLPPQPPQLPPSARPPPAVSGALPTSQLTACGPAAAAAGAAAAAVAGRASGSAEAEARAVVAGASVIAQELAGMAAGGAVGGGDGGVRSAPGGPDIQRLAWQLMEALELPPPPPPPPPSGAAERQTQAQPGAQFAQAFSASCADPRTAAAGSPSSASGAAGGPVAGRRRRLTWRQRQAAAARSADTSVTAPQSAAAAVGAAAAAAPPPEASGELPRIAAAMAPAAAATASADLVPGVASSSSRSGPAAAVAGVSRASAGPVASAATAASATSTTAPGRLLSATTDTLVASYRPLAFYAVMEAVAGATHLALTTRCGGMGLGWRLLGTTPGGTAAVYEWQPPPPPQQQQQQPAASRPRRRASDAASIGTGASAPCACAPAAPSGGVEQGAWGQEAPTTAESTTKVEALPPPPPLVFLHGIGMGLTPYLRVLGRLAAVADASAAAAHRPPQRLLAVQYKHVSMRITAHIPAPHEVAADVAAFLAAQGVPRMSVLAHSYGTLVASALIKLAAASPAAPAVHRLTLVDPVCFAMFLPHLTRNGLYQQPVTPAPQPQSQSQSQTQTQATAADTQQRQPTEAKEVEAAALEAAAVIAGSMPSVQRGAAVAAAEAGDGATAAAAGGPQTAHAAEQQRARVGTALGRRLACILLRGLVVAEFHCAVALRRRLDWARVNLWPSELPRGRARGRSSGSGRGGGGDSGSGCLSHDDDDTGENDDEGGGGGGSGTHVFLSGRDNLVPAAEVRQILANRAALLGPGGGPHPDVHFHAELGHGGFLGDLDWQERVIGAALGVPQDRVHVALLAARAAPAPAAAPATFPPPARPAATAAASCGSNERTAGTSSSSSSRPRAGVLRWQRGAVPPPDGSAVGGMSHQTLLGAGWLHAAAAVAQLTWLRRPAHDVKQRMTGTVWPWLTTTSCHPAALVEAQRQWQRLRQRRHHGAHAPLASPSSRRLPRWLLGSDGAGRSGAGSTASRPSRPSSSMTRERTATAATAVAGEVEVKAAVVQQPVPRVMR